MKHLYLWFKLVSLMAIMMGSDCLERNKCPASRFSADKTSIRIDFEDETTDDILIDKSQGPVKWKIEDYDDLWEPNCRPPRPTSGYKYIRVDRGSTRSFGVAVLSFPDLFLTSFETLTFSFSFWISSKWSKFNNLQLFVVENGHETLLKDLSENSNNQNQEWIVVDGIRHKPSESLTSISFVFYAFCGTNVEDAIAIDNILVTQLRIPALSTKVTTDSTTRVSATAADSTTITTTKLTTQHTTKRFTTSNTTTSTMTSSLISSTEGFSEGSTPAGSTPAGSTPAGPTPEIRKLSMAEFILLLLLVVLLIVSVLTCLCLICN